MIVTKKKEVKDSQTLKEVVFTSENSTDEKLLAMLSGDVHRLADMMKQNGTGETSIITKVQVLAEPQE